MNIDIEDRQKSLQNITQSYQQFGQLVDARILQDMQMLVDTFLKDASNASNEQRLLRIGIIGQIKRGKSSFLNSLLFDSKDVLPKAATPMTAALTKISYAEKPQASVEFYTPVEWQKVEQAANKVQHENAAYQQALQHIQLQRQQKQGVVTRPEIPKHTLEEKACAELLGMVKNSGLKVSDYLGSTQMLADVGSNEELVNRLNEYVGAAGKFTPIVKCTELKLALDVLNDIEIVDTPGMNDPIISRGRRTQEFMGQCDVIFLLSYSGMFFDGIEMNLLAQNIPSKGIKDIVLIGSMFDSALNADCNKYTTLVEALPKLTTKLSRHAEDIVNRICEKARLAGTTDDVVQHALREALPPIFISSRCLDLSRKNCKNLNEEEQHSLNLMNKMFFDFTFTPEILQQLSNFGPVHEKMTEVRSRKAAILADRYENLLEGVKNGFLQLLDKLVADVNRSITLLKEGDIAIIARQQEEVLARIHAGKSKVSAIFDKYSIQIEKQLAMVQGELQQAGMDAKRVNSKSGSREESYTTTSQVYDPELLSPRTWVSKKTVHTTNYRTVNYTYANVHDAVEQLENFVIAASRRLFDVSSRAINLDMFRQDIKSVVKDMFVKDENFDPQMILLPLANAVDRILIPSISIDLDHHIDTIRQQFNSGEVEGDEMSRLRIEQARVVQLLLTDINKELDKLTKVTVAKMKKEEAAFIPDLSRDLVAKVEQLSRDLEDKEQALATYEKIQSLLKKDMDLVR